MPRRPVLLLLLVLLAVLVTIPVTLPILGQPTSSTEESEAEGGAETSRTDRDTELERHLEATFAQLESLEGIEVSVTAGVVRLEGEVLSTDARELAEKLAEDAEGVMVVDNRIDEVHDLRRRLGPALDKLRERGLDLLALLPLLGVAILVVAGFYFLSRWIGRWEMGFLPRASSHFLDDLVRQVMRLVVVLIGILLALDLLDATALVGAVLGTAGVVGLALGFAFRDTAENYIASILLSVRQPFAPNDTVVIEGFEGKVVRLTSRATILLTMAGNHVRIPNATVFKGVVVNYSQNPQRRFDFVVGVGTEEDLSAVLQLGVATLLDTAGVLADPPPQMLIENLGDSAVQLHVFAWVDQREASLVKVKSEAIRRVKEAYDTGGVSMPEPIYQIRGLDGEEVATDERLAERRGERRGEREEVAEPKPRPLAKTSEPADIAPETHTDRQVEADRAAAGETDLLDPEAPKE